MNRNPHVAVVGATGAVGVEMIKTLEKRNFPVGKLTLLASARSVGKLFPFRGQDIAITELTKDSFAGVDIALFSAGGAISKEFAPIAVKAGCVVVDNSSVFRQDPTVPLVVPEINADDCTRHQGIIANPNCTTAITLMALYPLHQAFGVTRIFASSYQAVSGTGAKALEELERQVDQIVKKQPVTKEVYPHQIAYFSRIFFIMRLEFSRQLDDFSIQRVRRFSAARRDSFPSFRTDRDARVWRPVYPRWSSRPRSNRRDASRAAP